MNIGILGAGTIGGGVLDIIDNKLNDKGVKVVKVFDMPSKKELLGERYAESADEVCLCSDVDVVIEALGGDKFPYDCIVKALKNGKSVVTSNKEVVAAHMEEFYDLAKLHGVYFMAEASVGGGIPLICSLIDEIRVNKVSRIYGIINGTTNFILTKMQKESMSFDAALQTAKDLGFAEYDATADLEGLDMTRKIRILSSIAYGAKINVDEIYHYGISGVTEKVLADADKKGYAIKFVAESKVDGDKVKMSVEPVLVQKSSPLSAINYEYNAVYIDCDLSGTLGFYGKGAGRYPTAAAMVSDVLRIKSGSEKYYYNADKEYAVDNFLADEYYVFDGKESKIVAAPERSDYAFSARVFKI